MNTLRLMGHLTTGANPAHIPTEAKNTHRLATVRHSSWLLLAC